MRGETEVTIVESWPPSVPTWCVTGEPGRWRRARLFAGATVEAATTDGKRVTVRRFVTGLVLEQGQAEICSSAGYFVTDWPMPCRCDHPRTSDLDPAWCSRCACPVPPPAPQRDRRPSGRSAVDRWMAEQETNRG